MRLVTQLSEMGLVSTWLVPVGQFFKQQFLIRQTRARRLRLASCRAVPPRPQALMPAFSYLPAAAVLAIAVTVTACDNASSPSSASSWSPSRLNLRAGPQSISFLAFGISADPQLPACTPVGVPAGGTSVATRVVLERDGSDWIARSGSAATGTLELRLRESGVSGIEGEGVTGTIRGSGIDTGEGLRAPLDVRINVGSQGGTAALEGVVNRGAFLASGRINGSITFTDSHSAAATCTVAQWLMQPVSGVLAAATANLLEPAW